MSGPFAAGDNMRLPAYRASHLARFHPYPRTHPSHYEERLLARLLFLAGSPHADAPNRPPPTTVFLRIMEALGEVYPQPWYEVCYYLCSLA
jgi:hypothetical protein